MKHRRGPWLAIETATGWKIPGWVRQACTGPKPVTIPAGRELFAAGAENKERMEWGAFEENNIGWYVRGKPPTHRCAAGRILSQPEPEQPLSRASRDSLCDDFSVPHGCLTHRSPGGAELCGGFHHRIWEVRGPRKHHGVGGP